MVSQALFDRFLQGDEATCEAEALALGQQGQLGLAALGHLLDAAQSDLRFWAVRGLWANGSAAAVAHLIAALADDEPMVRSGAALALGELKAEAAIDSLAELVYNDASAAGSHAGDALSKIGQGATPRLIRLLRAEPAWVRVRAAKALLPLEDRQAIGPLFQALEEDDSYLVRYYAELALERLGVGQMVYFK